MANERGKYEISGYLCFQESSEDPSSIGRKGEPEILLLNHWKKEINSEEKCFRWGVSQIRSYGYCGNIFMFDCARRSSRATLTSGETSTVVVSPTPQPKNLFQTDRARDIFKLLQRICKRQALRGNKGFESSNWFKDREMLTLRNLNEHALTAKNDVTEVLSSVNNRIQNKNQRQLLESNPDPRGHTCTLRGGQTSRSTWIPGGVKNRSSADILDEPTHHLVSYGSYIGSSSPLISSGDVTGDFSRISGGQNSVSSPSCSSAADRNNNLPPSGNAFLVNYSQYSTLKPRPGRSEWRKSVCEEAEKQMHLQTSCSSSSSAPFGTTGEKNQYKNLKRRRLDFQGQCQGQPSVESFQTMTSPSWHYVNSSNSPPGRNRTSFHCDGSPAKISWNSSGISSATSNLGDDASIFKFPPEVEDPTSLTCWERPCSAHSGKTRQDNKVCRLHSASKTNPTVVYSELDNSLVCATTSTNVASNGGFIGFGCNVASDLSQQGRVSETALASKDNNSSLVSYSVLDVDRTRALASLGNDREVLNQWRTRRASSAAASQNNPRKSLTGIQEKANKNVNKKSAKRANSVNPESFGSEYMTSSQQASSQSSRRP